MQSKFEDDVQAAIDKGKTVTAIKLLRQHRGLDLIEAKELLDSQSVRQGSVKGDTGSKKGIINSVILAVVGFIIYKLFIES